jgi:hypothetical protein
MPGICGPEGWRYRGRSGAVATSWGTWVSQAPAVAVRARHERGNARPVPEHRSRWRTSAVTRIRRPHLGQRSQQGTGCTTMASGWWQAQWHSSDSGAWIGWGMSGLRLTTLRISCGRQARRAEFYGPLSASGGRRRPRTLLGAAPDSCMRWLGRRPRSAGVPRTHPGRVH